MIDSTNSIGIILRGQSIERLPIIIDNFETCFIVNWHREEFDLLGDYILEKNVMQYTNLKHNAMFSEEVYRKFNITKVAVPYCESMVDVRDFFEQQKTYGVEKFDFLPEEYIEELDTRPRNSGLTCIFYSSQVLKAKEIWIIGLDFYSTNYIGKSTGKKDPEIREERMMKRFVKYIEKFSHIQYNILSYNEKIPKFGNLNIIGGENENNRKFN